MEKEIVCIEWRNLSLAQMIYAQAVIVPKLEIVLAEHIHELMEIEREHVERGEN